MRKKYLIRREPRFWLFLVLFSTVYKKLILAYTTQVNSTFRARWLASSKVISQVLFTYEQPKKN